MIWSFYCADTGVFTGQRFKGPYLNERNIPQGCKAFEGDIDHRRLRLDIDTVALVDHTPPAEDSMIVESRALSLAMAEIESLERLQIRSMSDLFDDPTDQVARENYNRRKFRIAELRERVSAGREAILGAAQSLRNTPVIQLKEPQ